eukprot:CAMPEP_0170513282 /NCGR_PEP_ID=MMETSP0208-20121228/67317_1 /TAXON_ID=197538 /ORGANISM="Strombidium inclinatum, Strain S3" /LENGTH=65 /DNA_ID=CAMNT_0010797001 /DNA_START=962 /DNA_END=1159 /DNA_ORIENTATION=-
MVHKKLESSGQFSLEQGLNYEDQRRGKVGRPAPEKLRMKPGLMKPQLMEPQPLKHQLEEEKKEPH